MRPLGKQIPFGEIVREGDIPLKKCF